VLAQPLIERIEGVLDTGTQSLEDEVLQTRLATMLERHK
jgi:hypothetical protein